MWQRFQRYFSRFSRRSRFYSAGSKTDKPGETNLSRKRPRLPGKGGKRRPTSTGQYPKAMDLVYLLSVVMLMATVTGCALSSKSKKPKVVVVPDSQQVIILDKKTDTERLEGWYVISPGHYLELNDDLAESDSNLAECLCLLRGENPAKCEADAPNIPPNRSPRLSVPAPLSPLPVRVQP